VSSASASCRRITKLRRTGRHAVPARARRAATVISVAIPTIALAGACAAYYGFQQPAARDPVASSVVSYSIRALQADSRQPDAGDAGRLSGPATGATPKQTASPAAKPSAAPAAPSPAVTCSGTGGVGGTGLLPLNYATIVNFLVAHGYTAMGAVGVAGNIYQESKGDPESVGSGGGGLIGWTPLPAGYVTGNAVADLQTQLTALLSYNQQWAQYLPMLNAASTPTDAADIYMNYFERPGIPAATNREGAAAAVAQACGIG
jgi:hypothetical protein